MADLIVGYPSDQTVVSSGTGGNIRVTYPPWELDWEFFDGIATDLSHFLANTTTAVSVAINAKGGAEHLGYWFEINLAFPSANWNSGDRITPQRQAAITQFATIAAALVGMAMDDVWLLWYKNTNNSRVWHEQALFAGIAGSVWGMLSRSQITIANIGQCAYYNGNLLAQAVQARMVNITAITTRNTVAIYYYPTIGQAGAGISIERCRITGYYGVSFFRANAGTCRVINCEFFICGVAIDVALIVPELVSHNTCVYGQRAASLGNHIITNTIGVEQSLSCFLNSAGATFCVDSDGTLPAVPSNLRNQDVRSQLEFFCDIASPGQKKNALDFRIYRDSVAIALGTPTVVVVDQDGRARPNPPSIGAFEPYDVCYAPGAEIIRGAAKRGVNT